MATLNITPTTSRRVYGDNIAIPTSATFANASVTDFSTTPVRLFREGTNLYDVQELSFEFDTSPIPDDALILSATLTMNVGSYYLADAFKYLSLLILNDESALEFTSVSGTLLAEYPQTALSNGSNAIPVADNLAQISKSSPTRFRLAIGEPAGTGVDQYVYLTGAPTLTIEYNSPPAKPFLTAPDGGETWANSQTITWVTSSDSDSDPITYQVGLSLDNGVSWSTIGSGITGTSYTYNFSPSNETSFAKVRVRAYDGYSYSAWDTSAGVFTIKENVAPSMPTNLSPSGGVLRSNVQPITLSWQFNDDNVTDYQTKADIQYRIQGDTVWTDVTHNSSDTSYAVVLSTADTYEWRVRTYDRDNVVSPWSNTEVFIAGVPSTAPVITSPTSPIPESRPVIAWTSIAQESYQVVIEDALGVILWDTGEVISTNQAVTSGIDLVNGATYTIAVRIREDGGLLSPYTELTSAVSYTPPVKPDVAVSVDNGSITLAITADAPTGSEPTTQYYEVYKEIDGLYRLIAYNVQTSFTDYHVAHGREYRYYVKAIGDNGTVNTSDMVSASVTLDGVYIHALRDPAYTSHYFRYAGVGYSDNYEPESAIMKYQGRRRPVINYGTYADYTISRRIQEVEGMGDMDALREFVRNRETIVYRDDDGNIVVGFLRNIAVDKQYRVSEAEITVIETAHTEGV